MTQLKSSVFERLLLPGFAFKAVVIGGGYATGRELAEFFLPAGPWGGVLGMLLAMVLWSVICAITFLFARATGSRDYGSFFLHLLGPVSGLFDIAYLCLVVVMLSVFGAAAGALGQIVFSWPDAGGVLLLMFGMAVTAAFGNKSVERLFKYATYFLYTVYAIFLTLAVTRFAHLIGISFSTHRDMAGWASGGLTYTGYNIIGAVVVLPVLRHLRSDRDALIAGLMCGPLGMLPALVFFICMAAFYPAINVAALPSDFLLSRLNNPLLHVTFQIMIFVALLESGTGAVHAINERAARLFRTAGHQFSAQWRLISSCSILIISIVFATRYGLVAIIANGYRLLAYVFLAIYVLPLLTIGLWRLVKFSNWHDRGDVARARLE